jgi:hypothetical protein
VLFSGAAVWDTLTLALADVFLVYLFVCSLFVCLFVCLCPSGIEFRSTLNNMKDELPMLKEVRGRGLLNAIVIEENFGPNQDKDAMDVSGKQSGGLLFGGWWCGWMVLL